VDSSKKDRAVKPSKPDDFPTSNLCQSIKGTEPLSPFFDFKAMAAPVKKILINQGAAMFHFYVNKLLTTLYMKINTMVLKT
jgi:hypothetical protein